MARDRLEERTVQHHELDVHVRAVRLIKGVHVRGVLQRLVRVGDLVGGHGQPHVLTLDAVGAAIVRLAGGEGRPLDHDVLPPVVGAGLAHDGLDEGRVVDLGDGLEAPFLDAAVAEPAEEAGLERFGLGVDHVLEPGVGIDLVAGERLHDRDEAVVRRPLHAEDVDDLALGAGIVVDGHELLSRPFGRPLLERGVSPRADRLGIDELGEVQRGEEVTAVLISRVTTPED
mmetsp:Transcript_53859/g.114422  ORF Transcript_53859/g.114422 Transcript_53859/m.114422 type:complete len:229 (+) Transcript_53859:550-1236(+)